MSLEEITHNETQASPPKAKSTWRVWMRSLRPKHMLNNENFVHALPFIFFLSALAMLYIGNAYYAERTIRDLDRTNNEIKELRSEFIATKSALMLMSRQSAVAKEVHVLQLSEPLVPPHKIVSSSTASANGH